MEASRRDGTDEWVLPEHSRPPSVKELEARIDVAMSRARSAETAASAIGSAALDAAEQARRSAEAAERTHMLLGERLTAQPGQPSSGPADPSPQTAFGASPVSNGLENVGPGTVEEAGPEAAEPHEEDPMRAFISRADRISLRLQKLQSAPLSVSR
jgi:hypothetical protein